MFEDRSDYNTPAYKAWSYGVKSRDGFACGLCHKKGVPLESHHIKRWADYPHLRYVHSNGITLCKECHQMVTGREQDYEDQFKRILELKGIAKVNSKKPKVKGEKRDYGRGRYKYKPLNPRLRY